MGGYPKHVQNFAVVAKADDKTTTHRMFTNGRFECEVKVRAGGKVYDLLSIVGVNEDGVNKVTLIDHYNNEVFKYSLER